MGYPKQESKEGILKHDFSQTKEWEEEFKILVFYPTITRTFDEGCKNAGKRRVNFHRKTKTMRNQKEDENQIEKQNQERRGRVRWGGAIGVPPHPKPSKPKTNNKGQKGRARRGGTFWALPHPKPSKPKWIETRDKKNQTAWALRAPPQSKRSNVSVFWANEEAQSRGVEKLSRPISETGPKNGNGRRQRFRQVRRYPRFVISWEYTS